MLFRDEQHSERIEKIQATWAALEARAGIRETKESNVPSDAVREELLRRPAEKLLALV